MEKRRPRKRVFSGFLRVLCMLLLLIPASSGFALSREPAITIQEKGKPLSEILAAIEKQAGVYFFYSDKDVDLTRMVSLNLVDQPLDAVLKACFANTSTDFRIDGNQIFLSKKPVQPEAPKPVLHITGTVKDDKKQPVLGATVLVDGTTRGTSTGVDGAFAMDVQAGSRLRISFLGYGTEFVPVTAAKTNYEVTMTSTDQNLEEVVIVAYGVQKKESVTGAISSMQTKELKQSSSANLTTMLAGRLSGISAIQSSGQPGKDDAEIYLRGIGTMNGSSPLILIDGVPRDNMSVMDPNEIESISVLKDASATAVFGVRGANGAILITTKRGEVGKMSLSVNVEASMQSFTRQPEKLESWEWMKLRNEVATNEGFDAPYTPEHIAKYTNPKKTELEKYMYPSHYWYEELMQKFAPQVKTNVNVSGGTERLQYFINAGFIYQGGQFKIEDGLNYNPQSKMNRYSFRANVDYKIARNLKAYLNLGSYLEHVNMPSSWGYPSDDALMSDIFRNLMYSPPFEMGPTTIAVPGSDEPGGDVIKFPNLDRTAYELVNRRGYRRDTRMSFNGSYGMDWDMDFITKGLSLKGMVSIDSYSTSSLYLHKTVQQYVASIVNDQPVFSTNMQKGNTMTLKSATYRYQANMQLSLNYSRLFGEKHRVGALLLAQRDYWDLVSPDLPYNVLGFCARATYAFKDKYMAEFNFGYNGSEQFAPAKRFGTFPAFSAGWMVSNERFFEPLRKVVSSLKLRASYGKVGNDKQGSSRFLYMDKMYYYDRGTNGSYGEFFLPSLSNGYYIQEGLVGNKNLTWETATQQNYGIDLQLFGSLNISLDYFRQFRESILILREMVPDLQGVERQNIPRANIGEMENHGFDLEINYGKRINKDLYISARGNFNFNRNKVLYADEPLLAEDYAYRYRSTGHPYGTYWGYEIDKSNGNGYFNTEEEIERYVDKNGNKIRYDFGNYGLGDFKYVDQNGDGVVDPKDQVPIGHTRVPEISYGLSATIEYKMFDLSFMFQGVGRTSQFYFNEGVWEYLYGGMYFDYHKHAWTAERYAAGEDITYPALKSKGGVNHTSNSFFIMDRSFLRLKNLEIGFNMPKKWLRSVGMSNVRLYVRGQNLFTWDKLPMSTIDPEPRSTSDNLNALMYPISRIYTFGANITF